MMKTFKENINRICRERNTSLTSVVKGLDKSTSFVTTINKGGLPKEKDLMLLAEALNCSVMDFFLDGDEEEAMSENKSNQEPLDDDEQDLIRIYRLLSRSLRHEFMSTAYRFEKEMAV